ncbi:MAG: S-methyl-5-thioribose-1-phosphate isomerase [Spirochaetales bacterium]|nr:S-methyl-5-thioribose-1-phosphate isomerase [Spirochaetales bacterium]
MLVNGTHYRTVWLEGQVVKMINQPLIPHDFKIHLCMNHKETAVAISTMIIRGAGAIGAAAGYGLAQAALEAPEDDFSAYVKDAFETIKNTRPTAQNLFYALERVNKAILRSSSPETARQNGVNEAEAIADEDAASCKRIGELGEALIKDGFRILTHCNAGWLAFVDWGSAISPVYSAKRSGKKVFVWVDETRPRCQGARLTAWELLEEGVDNAVIADNASGYYMHKGEVDMVIVGSDRIAANGDVANKIGTYEKAVLAKENNIPFYVAAPTSTIDWNCPTGESIPIEERGEEEVLGIFGRDENNEVRRVFITPRGTKARNPAFDVTPAGYITGIITEKGIIKPGELRKAKENVK